MAEALRKEQMQRMQGMAGASGGPNATGTALKSSGPSASYAGRLVGRIKPNITYPGDMIGNPRAEVEVRVAADGTITSRRIVQSSGNKAWDDAVLRAIDKTEILPKDTDGRVPPLIGLGFRPLDLQRKNASIFASLNVLRAGWLEPPRSTMMDWWCQAWPSTDDTHNT